MKEKWQVLLNQLEITEDYGLIGVVSEERLKVLEYELKTPLPIEYKNFCQVFGIGELGKYIAINFWDISESEIYINSMKLDLECDNQIVDGDILDIESLKNLLNSAFVFGDNICADVVFWDLRTYSELDQSYDIYMANADCFIGVYKIGRDFYEFIKDFCLGLKSYKILPKSKHPEENFPTFSPFGLPSEKQKLQAYLQGQKYIRELRDTPEFLK